MSRFQEPSAIYSGDVRNYDDVSRWVRGLKDVHAIVHLAALVPKQIVNTEPLKAFETNVGGTLNILEALRRLKELGQKTPWLFYASSSHVYAPSPVPIKECGTRDPFTLYGQTKLQGEDWCDAYAKNYGLDVCIGRIFSFSDVQQPDYYFLPAMFKRIRNAPIGADVRIPGVQGYRDFLRVQQISETVHTLAKLSHCGPINIGTGKAHKLSDLVLQIADRLGRSDLNFEFVEGPSEALIADNSRLQGLGVSLTCQVGQLIEEMATA